MMNAPFSHSPRGERVALRGIVDFRAGSLGAGGDHLIPDVLPTDVLMS